MTENRNEWEFKTETRVPKLGLIHGFQSLVCRRRRQQHQEPAKGSSENIGAMDSIKEAKSDGQQSQLVEADPEKPLEKPLIKANVFIPYMVVLIPNTAIFVCGGFHYLLAAMKAQGLFSNIFVVGAIVVYFTVVLILVIIRLGEQTVQF
ncbi:hypothetical protein SUGI_1025600 [Cryptomeria japonica]|nr:hypothetical protein SUGI_1025600 [Cryptomeria japonica]